MRARYLSLFTVIVAFGRVRVFDGDNRAPRRSSYSAFGAGLMRPESELMRGDATSTRSIRQR